MPLTCSDECLVRAIELRQQLNRAAKAWSDALEEQIIAALDDRGGSVDVPGTTVRWYAAASTKSELVANWRIIDAMLERHDGNIEPVFDEIIMCLKTGAFNVTPLREVLGKAGADKLTVMKSKTKLKDGKQAKRSIKSADSKYLT